MSSCHWSQHILQPIYHFILENFCINLTLPKKIYLSAYIYHWNKNSRILKFRALHNKAACLTLPSISRFSGTRNMSHRLLIGNDVLCLSQLIDTRWMRSDCHVHVRNKRCVYKHDRDHIDWLHFQPDVIQKGELSLVWHTPCPTSF